MCGIIGVQTKEQKAAVDWAAGLLFRLQHRGQDGAGLVSFGEGKFHFLKGRGLVSDALGEWGTVPESNVALGHTRYATTGIGGVVELQPFLSGAPKIAMAHNGNISNVHHLREVSGLSYQTESDLEVMQEFFLKSYMEHGFEKAVQDVFDHFEGGYAVVGILDTGELFAFRDPYGVRPLFMGNSHEAVIFASETGALNTFKQMQITEVPESSWVLVSKDGNIKEGRLSSKKNQNTQRRICMFESVYFSSPQSAIYEVSVYRQRFDLGRYLARTIQEEWKTGFVKDEVDFVVPVPETSRIATTAVAEELGIPYREFLIKNAYVPRTFILSSQEKRLKALSQKMSLVGPELKDKRILLVDDSVVRGNTSRLMAERLKESGAKSVYMASTCPPIVSGCYYGIDFPDETELIANGADNDEIAKQLGVDGIYYLPVDKLKKALRSENLCTGCLGGGYPYGEDHHHRFKEERRRQRCL